NAENFMRLELKNAHAIEKVLENPINKIKIYAATTGIALKPAKQQSNSDSGASSSLDKLALGTSIKKNQSLVSIGDMSGIEIQVNVDQVSINSIKPGQQAIISSSAFPKIKLQGVVSSVTEQAASNNDSNLPTFPVLIQVAKMTQQQQQQIRDGMNAKVSIYIKQKQAIKVPITAVFAKNDQSYVKILNPKTGKLKAIRIETGRTELNTVVVLKGLKSGDKIASRH
ncbi:MAG: HlyD family efflux transporter periplasmic adaptor subunit, partial [Pseudomonadota bacterium]